MVKIRNVIITVACGVALLYAGETDTTETKKAEEPKGTSFVHKEVKVLNKKKGSIVPDDNNPTNWSKIKDLFL